jgi:Mg2+/Co2+ transporter CorB
MISEIEINAIIVASLLIAAGFISCFETSITAASRAKIYRLGGGGSNKKINKLELLLKDRDKVVSVMLIANNVVNILASVLTTRLLLQIFGEVGLLYSTIFLTLIIVIFGEILPKTYAIRSPEKIVTNFASVIILLFRIFFPFVIVTQKISNFFLNIFKGKNSAEEKASQFQEIRDSIDLKVREGSIVKYDKELIGGILDLSDVDISEIMVHRKDMASLDSNLNVEIIIEKAIDLGHSKIPLWEDNNENVIGVLNVKKMLKKLHEFQGDLKDFELKNVVSKPWYVPSSNSLKEQLAAFRRKKKKFSLVVDEYGTLIGLVTLQDILEEIVGEMKEIGEVSNDEISRIRKGVYRISGRTLIRDINKKLDWKIEEGEDAYSLSAFLIGKIDRIPEIQESFIIDGYSYEILKKKNHEIVSVKVKS